MLNIAGGFPVVKVADFGTAQRLDPGADAFQMTESGMQKPETIGWWKGCEGLSEWGKGGRGGQKETKRRHVLHIYVRAACGTNQVHDHRRCAHADEHLHPCRLEMCVMAIIRSAAKKY